MGLICRFLIGLGLIKNGGLSLGFGYRLPCCWRNSQQKVSFGKKYFWFRINYCFFFLMEKTEEKEWQPFLMWFRAKSLCVMLYFIHGIWVTPYTGVIYKSSLCCFCYWWPVKYLTTIDPNSSKNVIFGDLCTYLASYFLLILMLYFCSKYSASRILYEYSFLKAYKLPPPINEEIKPV